MKFRVPNHDLMEDWTGMVCEVCEEPLDSPEDVYALCSLNGKYVVTLCRQHFELAVFMRDEKCEMKDKELV